NFNLRSIFSASLLLALHIGSPHYAAAQFTAKKELSQFAQGRWGGMSFTLNNKIYVAGGYGGQQGGWMNDVMIYDPANNTWGFKNNLPGGLTTNRSAGVAFVLNGKAYLGLGASDFLSTMGNAVLKADMYKYDDAADSWSAVATLPAEGRTDAATFVLNNKAYVVGGT